MPEGEIGFGSLRMANREFAKDEPGDRSATCRTPELFGAIALFDLWLGNTDRHRGNLAGSQGREAGSIGSSCK